MNQRKTLKITFMAGTVCAVGFCNMQGSRLPVASAKSHEVVAADLGEIVVTATRSKKLEVDVPAATEVIKDDQIKDSGARNAGEVLSKLDGIAFDGFGQNGAAMGTMANEINIRGVDNGTLILVNGNPVSWRGKYDLSAIPAASIERIEVVKGGGSVLYGSEAMAGVVNIITKKSASNTVTAGIGSSGQHYYNVNAGDERLVVNYDSNEWNHGLDVSRTTAKFGETRTNLHHVEKQNVSLGYALSPTLNFFYGYYATEATYDRWVTAVTSSSAAAVGDLFNSRKYMTKRHITQLNFHDKDWKGSLYFNNGTVESDGPTNFSATGTRTKLTEVHYNNREKNMTYGVDLQHRWRISPKVSIISGTNIQREDYQQLASYSTATSAGYDRNNLALFTQVEQVFDRKNTGIFGGRETWTAGAWRNQNYNDFSASGQWLHKMNDNNNLYVSISQSFIMPTFAQMYGATTTAVQNPDLKPQKGINYEWGWKQKHHNHNWRAALFHMDITDNISAKWTSTGSYSYTNEDFRNTGIELSTDIKSVGRLSYHYGVTWQNPEVKSTKKDYWDRKFGKVQLTGGITYKSRKLTSSLNASYLCDRVQTPSTDHSFASKPYLLTQWNTIYHPDNDNELSLTINNVLDRHDIISNSASTYYGPPVSYMLNYTYKF